MFSLKEFNDFHYCGNPGFSLVSVAHPRRPGRPPWTPKTAQPHSAPRAVCTFYILLFTILFTTLRFPKSTATPDHGVGGYGQGGIVGLGWTICPRRAVRRWSKCSKPERKCNGSSLGSKGVIQNCPQLQNVIQKCPQK